MNKKVFSGLLVGLFALVGCSTKDISKQYANAKNGDDITVSGVVYGVVKGGYFVADKTGKIYVQDKNTTVAVGDKVTVNAKYALASGRGYVKADEGKVKVAKKGLEAASYEAYTVKQISELEANNGNYYKPFAVTGSLSVNSAGEYSIADDNDPTVTVKFADNSDVEALAAVEGKRVDVEVVAFATVNSVWTVTYCSGAKLVVNEKPMSVIKAEVEADLAKVVPTEIQGAITLPTTLTNVPAVKYTWSSSDATVIKITDNKAKVYELEEDKKVTLTCTITRGSDSETTSVEVNSKKIVLQQVKAFRENLPTIEGSVVKLEGVIISKAMNQSGTLWAFIIQDKTDNSYSTQVECKSADFAKYNIGDLVEIKGAYRTIASGDRPTIENGTFTLKKSNQGAKYVSNLTVNSAETMTQVTKEYNTKYTGQVVTLDHPYVKYVTRSGGDTIDIAYKNANGELETSFLFNGEDARTTPCFVVARIDSFMGNASWRENITSEFTEYPGTIVAIPTYYGSISIFSIPQASSITFDDAGYAVEFGIKSQVKSNIYSGTLDLPAKVSDIDITWTSSDPTVISNAGKVTVQEQESKVVTMTASYTYKGTEKSVEVKVTVLKSAPLTVSELAEMTGTGTFDVNCTVYGFSGQQSSASKTSWEGANSGGSIVIGDGANFFRLDVKTASKGIYLTNNGYFYDKDESKKVAIGDSIQIKGLSLTQAGWRAEMVSTSSCTFVSSGNATKYLDSAEWNVVTNKDEMVSVFTTKISANNQVAGFTMIQFVGTKDSPLYLVTDGSYIDIGYGSTAADCKFDTRTKSFRVMIHNALLNKGYFDVSSIKDQPLVGTLNIQCYYNGSTGAPSYYCGIMAGSSVEVSK